MEVENIVSCLGFYSIIYLRLNNEVCPYLSLAKFHGSLQYIQAETSDYIHYLQKETLFLTQDLIQQVKDQYKFKFWIKFFSKMKIMT